MCGIAGALALRDGARVDRERLCAMAGLMGHRGPDGEGFWTEPRGRVAFAHRRLSVIDIAGGRQPMCSDDGRIALVFNGEIYNYRELRRALSDQGVRFHTAWTPRYCCGCTSAAAARRCTISAACSPSPCGTGHATSWCSRGIVWARSPCSTRWMTRAATSHRPWERSGIPTPRPVA